MRRNWTRLRRVSIKVGAVSTAALGFIVGRRVVVARPLGKNGTVVYRALLDKHSLLSCDRVSGLLLLTPRQQEGAHRCGAEAVDLCLGSGSAMVRRCRRRRDPSRRARDAEVTTLPSSSQGGEQRVAEVERLLIFNLNALNARSLASGKGLARFIFQLVVCVVCSVCRRGGEI